MGSPPIKTDTLTSENATHQRRVGALWQQGRLSSFRGPFPNFAPYDLGSRAFPILSLSALLIFILLSFSASLLLLPP